MKTTAVISEQTFYRWKAEYGGLEASDGKKLRHLAIEADTSLTGKRVRRLFDRVAAERSCPSSVAFCQWPPSSLPGTGCLSLRA